MTDPFGDRINVVQDDPGPHDADHPGHIDRPEGLSAASMALLNKMAPHPRDDAPELQVRAALNRRLAFADDLRVVERTVRLDAARDSRPVGEGLAVLRELSDKASPGRWVGHPMPQAEADGHRLGLRDTEFAVACVNYVRAALADTGPARPRSGPADAQTCTFELPTGVCGWFRHLHDDAARGHAFAPPYLVEQR